MGTGSVHGSDQTDGTLLRVGGLLGFLILGVFVVVNFLLIDPPPSGAAPAELKSYLSDQAGTMAIANGLRNLAFFCVPFFAVGVYTLTGRSATLAGNAWGIVGLLGAAALMTMGTISNAIQTLIFLNIKNVSERPEIFLLLWSLTRVLFRAAQLCSGAMLAGFSIAGWRFAAMPTWLVVVGLIAATANLLTCVGIASVMTGGWASNVRVVAEPLGLVWFLWVSVLMVRRASA